MRRAHTSRIVGVLILMTGVVAGCSRAAEQPVGQVFPSPEAAVQALGDAAAKSDLAAVLAIFGPDGRMLVDTSDPDTGRRNRQVFTVAMAEGWHFEDQGQAKVLVVGREAWPFPVPLVQSSNGWHFDTAAGIDEVLARRVGRNELAVIRICRTYVAAQRLYSRTGHDGAPDGIYAASFRSEAGRHNGLYWPAAAGQPRSPLGDLMPAAEERATEDAAAPTPFHGYLFRILTAQGASAAGGAKNYFVNGRLVAGFGLVAWPAHYDASGVMTFIVNQDGVVYQKDLGTATDTVVQSLRAFDPDATWSVAE